MQNTQADVEGKAPHFVVIVLEQQKIWYSRRHAIFSPLVSVRRIVLL
jgi:hypothetical protein